jgi:solute:Na+ symporter, SSS family
VTRLRTPWASSGSGSPWDSTAIWAFSVCFVVTLAVSLITRPRPEEDLVGLVYSLTPRLRDPNQAWYARPAVLGAGVLAATLILNLLFW